MPTEWIMALGVLLVAGAILCVVVRRHERREKPWQLKASEESARRIALAKERDRRGAEAFIAASDRLKDNPAADRKQPDIPVWRDTPNSKQEERT